MPDLKTYEFDKSVKWVNREKIKDGQTTIKLTEAEAAFDLAQGRIWLKGSSAKASDTKVSEPPKEIETKK